MTFKFPDETVALAPRENVYAKTAVVEVEGQVAELRAAAAENER